MNHTLTVRESCWGERKETREGRAMTSLKSVEKRKQEEACFIQKETGDISCSVSRKMRREASLRD